MCFTDWTDDLTQMCVERHEAAFESSALSCSSYIGVCKDPDGKLALQTVAKGVLYLPDEPNNTVWSVTLDDLPARYAQRAMATALFQCTVSHCVENGITDLRTAILGVATMFNSWHLVRPAAAARPLWPDRRHRRRPPDLA